MKKIILKTADLYKVASILGGMGIRQATIKIDKNKTEVAYTKAAEYWDRK